MSERQTSTAKIICQGGWNSNQNHLDLSENRPGWATRLLNFEPSLFGGYRRINGYLPLEFDYVEVDPDNAEGRILGIAIFESDIIAARKQKSGNTYKFYRWGQGSDWIPYDDTGLTLSSSGALKIRYATFNFDGTGKIIFVDGVNNATVFDGTNWFQIDPEDTGGEGNEGGDQALKAPKYVTVFKNHIFVSGDEEYNNIVAHSAPLDETTWTSAAGSGQVVASFPVVQIKPFRDENFVFGNLKISRITVDGTGAFLLNDVTKDIGCIASDSVQEAAGDLVYMSQDGIRTVAGTERIGDLELGTISKSIQQSITSLARTNSLQDVSSVLVRSKSQYRIFFNRGESQAIDTKGILGGLMERQDGVSWEWAELRGISAPVVTSGYIDNNEYVIHGDYQGRVYRQEIGNSFDGIPILAVYETPFLDFGDTEVRKTFRSVSVFIRSEGTSTFDLSARYDWDVYGTLNPDTYFFDEENLISWYGTAVYGVSVYSTISSPIFRTPLEGSGFSTRLIISSAAISDPFSVQGIILELSPNDRK